MEKITVIIPAYNAESTIRTCCESLQKQTMTDFEVILVDDGSKDATGTICDEFCRADKRFSVLHTENGGVSRARNRGLQQAEGEYITFIDSDDWVEPEYLQVLYDGIVSTDADMVISGAAVHRGGRIERTQVASQNSLEKLNGKELLERGSDPAVAWIGFAWGKMYKARLLKGLSYDEDITLCEDTLFNCRAALRTDSAVLLPECLYHYCIQSGGAVAGATPQSIRTKIIALRRIENMAQEHPVFQENIRLILHTTYLYEAKELCVQGQYDEKELLDIRKRLSELEKQVDRRRIPRNMKLKRLALELHPRFFAFAFGRKTDG